jgi:hypothetical protein
MVKEYQNGNYCGAEGHEHRMDDEHNDTVMNANKWKELGLKG